MTNTFNRKKHWEKIYQTKPFNEVSWYQSQPKTSLQFLELCKIQTSAKIIDVGGGNSVFVDFLLDKGYRDISVLDISETAINKAKKRLGLNAQKVKWIIADITKFKPTEKYDFWHDRAAFHFLTRSDEINQYVTLARNSIKENGILVMGTFSKNGPQKCSGIEIKQYSASAMTNLLGSSFERVTCLATDHLTPFGTVQNFTFCSFKKLPE